MNSGGHASNEAYLESRRSGNYNHLQEEYEADLFASHYVDPEIVIDFLQERLETIFTMMLTGHADKTAAEAQMREYENRITNLEEYWGIIP